MHADVVGLSVQVLSTTTLDSNLTIGTLNVTGPFQELEYFQLTLQLSTADGLVKETRNITSEYNNIVLYYSIILTFEYAMAEHNQAIRIQY